MKVTLEEFPPYYNQYPWSPVPDNVNYFVGREIELMGFWYQMANLVGVGQGQHSNLAFVGQRKLGKTAYLKRCYNIAFWEQDEVIPFYYSFAQNEQDETKNVLQIKNLQRDMPLLLLRQFLAFCSKDEYFIDARKTMEELLDYAKKINFPRFADLSSLISSCLKDINTSERIFILKDIWEMTQWLSSLMKKKCLLIIDEAQEMQISIYDGEEQFTCKGSIADIIQKQHSLVLISGSHVSMLVNEFLDYDFANRIQEEAFYPLEDEHAKQLIKRRCPKGYKNLADDLIDLVGGNPYYIEKILGFHMKYARFWKKQKDFSSKQGLQKAYDFEVLHSQGLIHNFWEKHLIKNKHDLNKDPRTKKGLTLQILYKIAKNPDKEIHYYEFLREFDIDEDMLEKKLKQLENANLIVPTGVSPYAYGFPDKILPVIINKTYHRLLLSGPSKKIAEEALQDFLELSKHFEKDANDFIEYMKEAQAKLKKAKDQVSTKIERITLQLTDLEKGFHQIQGSINFKKGLATENKAREKVRKMIEKQQGIFADYQLDGDVLSVNFTGTKSKTCQIDIYAKLKKTTKGKRKISTVFIAEIKNVKSKLSLKQAEKFVSSMRKIRDEKKLKKIESVYICTAGFAGTAEKYLKKHKIAMGTSIDVLS